MEGANLTTMSLLKVLIDIQDINGIRQKIRDKNTKFLEGEPLTPWDLIADVRDTIAKDANYWQNEEIIGNTPSQSPNTSFLANANTTHNAPAPTQKKSTPQLGATICCVSLYPIAGLTFSFARVGFRKVKFTTPRGGSEVNKTSKVEGSF